MARVNLSAGVSFLKYCATGVVNTLVSYLVFLLLRRIGATAAVSLAIGYASGMVTSYLLNALWTFAQPVKSGRQALRFLVANLFVLLISEALLQWIMHHITHVADVAQAINLLPTTLVGFYINRRYVFKVNSNRLSRDEKNDNHFWLFGLIAFLLVAVQRIIVLFGEWEAAKIHHLPVSAYQLWVKGMIHWDARWYLEIAQFGYQNIAQTAFWPFYPWVIRWTHEWTSLSYPVAAIVVSLVSFFLAIWVMLLWVNGWLGFKAALSAAILFCFYPTSFYFDAAYTESLFLLLMFLSVEASRRNRVWWANIFASLATLTRNTGGLIGFILFFQYLQNKRMDFRFWLPVWWRKLSWQAVAFLLPSASLLVYCYHLKQRFHSWMPFLKAERKHWHRQFMWPWKAFAHTLYLYHHPRLTVMQHRYIAFELAAFLVMLVLLVSSLGLLAWRRRFTEWGVLLYMLSVSFITSSEPSMNIPDYLVSLPRYVLMLFPGFAAIAKLLRSLVLCVLIAALCAIVLAWKSGVFFRGIWIA